jgi:hypothetical protein
LIPAALNFFFRVDKLNFLHRPETLKPSCSNPGTATGYPRMAAEHPESHEQTYYEVLGLPVSPSQISLREIKAAYHRALLTAHPDKVSGSSGAEVDLVREAWRVLGNDVLRKEYDAKIKSTRSRLTFPG